MNGIIDPKFNKYIINYDSDMEITDDEDNYDNEGITKKFIIQEIEIQENLNFSSCISRAIHNNYKYTSIYQRKIKDENKMSNIENILERDIIVINKEYKKKTDLKFPKKYPIILKKKM